MRSVLTRLKKVDMWEYRRWLKDNIPDLSEIQKDVIDDPDGFVRWQSPYRIYKEVEKKTPFWWRFTLPVYLIVFLLLFLFMPIKFFFTGNFRYGGIDWMLSWHEKLFG
jgi:lipopolysaccharide export LptBFGC system permease protein LptF